jgi:hypothetical protein
MRKESGEAPPQYVEVEDAVQEGFGSARVAILKSVTSGVLTGMRENLN